MEINQEYFEQLKLIFDAARATITNQAPNDEETIKNIIALREDVFTKLTAVSRMIDDEISEIIKDSEKALTEGKGFIAEETIKSGLQLYPGNAKLLSQKDLLKKLVNYGVKG